MHNFSDQFFIDCVIVQPRIVKCPWRRSEKGAVKRTSSKLLANARRLFDKNYRGHSLARSRPAWFKAKFLSFSSLFTHLHVSCYFVGTFGHIKVRLDMVNYFSLRHAHWWMCWAIPTAVLSLTPATLRVQKKKKAETVSASRIINFIYDFLQAAVLPILLGNWNWRRSLGLTLRLFNHGNGGWEGSSIAR